MHCFWGEIHAKGEKFIFVHVFDCGMFSGGVYETLSVSFALVEDCELYEILYVSFALCVDCVELSPLGLSF